MFVASLLCVLPSFVSAGYICVAFVVVIAVLLPLQFVDGAVLGAALLELVQRRCWLLVAGG